MKRVFPPVILLAVTLAWVASASALSISFLEPISPTANIEVSFPSFTGVENRSDELSSSVFTSPSVARVNLGPIENTQGTLALVGLTQPGSAGLSGLLRLTSQIEDVGGLRVVGFELKFLSDDAASLPVSENLTATFVESALPQVVVSGMFKLVSEESVDLTVTVQSLDAVPEPSTLLLFGSSLLAMSGTLWRRYRHS